MVKLGIIEEYEKDDKKQYYDTLKTALKNKVELGNIDYTEVLEKALETNNQLLTELKNGEFS